MNTITGFSTALANAGHLAVIGGAALVAALVLSTAVRLLATRSRLRKQRW